MNKNGVFFGLAAGMLLAAAADAAEMEVLRPEDEALVQTESVSRPVKISKPFYLAPAKVRPVVLPDTPAKPAAEALSERMEDENVGKLREMITYCLDVRQDRIELERSMYERLRTPESLAYLSETMRDVNLCYEDIGLEIIETYYDNDINELAKHHDISQTFYVNGTGLNFDPKFCGETCSMDAVFNAQMAKYTDFRVYLTKLLDKRPLKD